MIRDLWDKRMQGLDDKLMASIEDQNRDDELSGIADTLGQLEDKVSLCMTKAAAKNIWTYMQRFPHYDDLKDLNNKFLPQLASV